MSAYAWFLLTTLSVLWGGSFFFAEIALRQLEPLTIVLARVSLGAIALVIVAYLSGFRLPGKVSVLFALLIMGGLNNALPFTLLVWSQVHLSSGVASILNATTPLFTIVVAHFFTRDEPMTRNKIIGIVLGVIGVAALIGPQAISGLGSQIIAQVAVLCAACSYAVASVYGKRLRSLPTIVAAAGMLTGSSILMLPMALYFEAPFSVMPRWDVLLSVIGLALLSSALAYLIYFRILVIAGATNLMLVTLLVPVSALLLGVLVLGEEISFSAYVGMGIIFAGLICIDGRIFAIKNRAQQTTYHNHRQ